MTIQSGVLLHILIYNVIDAQKHPKIEEWRYNLRRKLPIEQTFDENIVKGQICFPPASYKRKGTIGNKSLSSFYYSRFPIHQLLN